MQRLPPAHRRATDGALRGRRLRAPQHRRHPDAKIVVDGDGAVVFANGAACELFLLEREALVGVTIERLVPQRHQARHVAARADFDAAPRRRAMGGSEMTALRGDGTEIPVDIMLSPIVHDGHRYVIAAIRDVSAQKAAQATLAHARAQAEAAAAHFRTLVENIPDHVFHLDNLGHARFANRALDGSTWQAAHESGAPRPTWLEGSTADSRARAVACLRDVLHDRTPRTFDIDVVIGGLPRVFSCRAAAEEQGGVVVGTVVISTARGRIHLDIQTLGEAPSV